MVRARLSTGVVVGRCLSVSVARPCVRPTTAILLALEWLMPGSARLTELETRLKIRLQPRVRMPGDNA